MKARVYTTEYLGQQFEYCDLVCTKEEAKALKIALEKIGVNIFVWSRCEVYDEYMVTVMNEYKTILDAFGEEKHREGAEALFNANAKYTEYLEDE